MRNHGVSPHVKPHNYDAMAADIALFVEKQGLKNVNLLGHSMGGKAVMAYALNSDLNGPLRSLMSVDMTPAIGKVSPELVTEKDVPDPVGLTICPGLRRTPITCWKLSMPKWRTVTTPTRSCTRSRR